MPGAVAAEAVAKPAGEPPQKAKKPRAPLTKKKLLAFALAGVLLLAALGGAAALVLIKRRAAAQLEGGDAAAAHAAPRDDAPPIYVPLETFTVNLADAQAERFAQVGVTFELEDAKAIERVKSYLPSIRNAILLILTRKSSAELLDAAGKERLAREIGREAARAMGYELPPAPTTSSPARTEGQPFGPIRHVHFANFIIQ